MRSTILSLAVLVGALGLVAVTPGEANAQRPWVNTGFNVGNYGYFNSFGRPGFNYYYNGYGQGRSLYHPGGYRTAFTPWGRTAAWASPSFRSVQSNLFWGTWLTVRTPSMWGYSFNPYFGVGSFYQPGITYQLPITAGYGGYVPPSYIIR